MSCHSAIGEISKFMSANISIFKIVSPTCTPLPSLDIFMISMYTYLAETLWDTMAAKITLESSLGQRASPPRRRKLVVLQPTTVYWASLKLPSAFTLPTPEVLAFLFLAGLRSCAGPKSRSLVRFHCATGFHAHYQRSNGAGWESQFRKTCAYARNQHGKSIPRKR